MVITQREIAGLKKSHQNIVELGVTLTYVLLL
jgi:hypothetical protein